MGQAAIRKKNGTLTKFKTPIKKITKKEPPHHTAETILPLFSSGAVVEIAGESVLPIDTEIGFLKFSDSNGGTAHLVDPITYKKLASFSAKITNEMRESKCSHPDCKCSDTKWTELLTGCTSVEHEDFDEDYLVPVRLYAALCKNPDCTEQHVWILWECTDGHVHRNSSFQLL